MLLEPNWSKNFVLGPNPTKITDNSQEDILTLKPLVIIIETVFSVRYELKNNKQPKKILLAFYEAKYKRRDK